MMIDQAREVEQQRVLQEQERLERIRAERESRVVREAELDEDHVTIIVNHPTLRERVTRLFSPQHTFQVVFDWLGSLSTQPEFFSIRDWNQRNMIRTSPVIAGVYHMVEEDSHEVVQELVSEGEAEIEVLHEEVSDEEVDDVAEPVEVLETTRTRRPRREILYTDDSFNAEEV